MASNGCEIKWMVRSNRTERLPVPRREYLAAIEQVNIRFLKDYPQGHWIHICLESPYLEASTFLDKGCILHSLKSMQLSHEVKEGSMVIKDFTSFIEFFHIDFTNTDHFCMTLKNECNEIIKGEATVLLQLVNV